MQLIINALGDNKTHYLDKLLAAISDSKCNTSEIRLTKLNFATSAYLLIDGKWNHIAKLENTLDAIQKQLNVSIQTLRSEHKSTEMAGIPYTLEAISLEKENIIPDICVFLLQRGITIVDITGSSYHPSYIDTPVFSCKFIITIPPVQRLLALREEFMDLCDQLNIDAILEPIKQ